MYFLCEKMDSTPNQWWSIVWNKILLPRQILYMNINHRSQLKAITSKNSLIILWRFTLLNFINYRSILLLECLEDEKIHLSNINFVRRTISKTWMKCIQIIKDHMSMILMMNTASLLKKLLLIS